MPWFTVTAPGDILGAITAGFNTLTSFSETIRTLAQDQTAEGRKLVQDLLVINAIPISLLTKLDKKLGLDVGAK